MARDVVESGDRPADELDEIEVTPEMIAAGQTAYGDHSPTFHDVILRLVYVEMGELNGGSCVSSSRRHPTAITDDLRCGDVPKSRLLPQGIIIFKP